MKVLSNKRRLVLVLGMLSAATGCHRQELEIHREFVPNVPHAALTIDGHTQVAWVGTLCWPSPVGDHSCIDYESPVTFGDPLVLGATHTATLTFSPEARPSKVDVQLIAVTPDMADTKTSSNGATSWHVTAAHPTEEWRAIPAQPILTQELRLEAPPGRYLLSVSAFWDVERERHGDTSQAFLIEVHP